MLVCFIWFYFGFDRCFFLLGFLASYKFMQKLWMLHQKFKDKIREDCISEDNEILNFKGTFFARAKRVRLLMV